MVDKKTNDLGEKSIAGNPKEKRITEGSKRTLSLRILKRVLSMRNLINFVLKKLVLTFWKW